MSQSNKEGDLSKTIEDLTEQLASSRSETEDCRRVYKELQAKYEKLETELKCKTDQLEQANGMVKQLNQENTKILTDLTSEKAKFCEFLDNANTQRDDFTIELRRKDEQIERMTEQLEQEAREKHTNIGDISSIRCQSGEMVIYIDENKDIHIDELSRELQLRGTNYTSCSKCQKPSDYLKLLPCYHSSCEPCLQQSDDTACFQCSSCNYPFKYDQINESPLNVYAKANLFRPDDSNAPLKNPATVNAHCTIHKGKPFELYCEKCRQPICSKCSINEHNDHHTELKDIDIVAELFRKQLHDEAEQLNATSEQCEERLLELKEASGTFRDRLKEMRKNVNMHTAQSIECLCDARNGLISRINDLSNEARHAFEQIAEATGRKLNHIRYIADLREAAARSENAGEVVYFYSSVPDCSVDWPQELVNAELPSEVCFHPTDMRAFMPSHFDFVGNIVCGEQENDCDSYKTMTWDAMAERLRQSNPLIDALTEELNAARININNYEKTMSLNDEQRLNAESELAQLRNTLSQLELSKDTVDGEICKLKKVICQSEALVDSQSLLVEETSAKLHEVSEEKEQLQIQYSHQVEEIRLLNERLAEVVASSETASKQLQQQLEASSNEINRYKAQHKKLITNMSETKNQFKSKYCELEERLKSSADKDQQLTAAREKINALMTELQAYKSNCQIQIQELKSCFIKVNLEKVALDEQCQQETKHIENLTYSLEQANIQLEAATQVIDFITIQRDEFKRLQQKLQQQLTSHEHLITSMTGQLRNCTSQLQKANDQVNQLLNERQLPESVLVHRLADQGKAAPIYGLAVLDRRLYVIRMSSSDIEVYSAETFKQQQQRLQLGGAIEPVDMTSCHQTNSLFIADSRNDMIHCVKFDGRIVRSNWLVHDRPRGIFVTSCNPLVLVTCKESRKLKLFKTNGDLVHQIVLDASLSSPHHAVQLTSGQFIVCHGEGDRQERRVCLVNEDGQPVIIHKPEGNSHISFRWPAHVAVDRRHGYSYVAEYNWKKIAILNDDLVEVAEVHAEMNSPTRLCLDVDNGRLYVAEVGGRIAVYSIRQRFAGQEN